MICKFKLQTWKQTGLALLLLGSVSAISAPSPNVYAAAEGVYISDKSFFTLEQAALSSASLQFSIALHNGGSQAIDFNEYGVRVTDTDGHSFTARLSEKKSGSVSAGQDQTFKFYSELAAGETAEQLQVDVFRWDSSKSNFMNHIGFLPVAPALQEGKVGAQEEIINLYTVDSSLANDAAAAFQLGQSVRVFENGKWVMYTSLHVINQGSGSVGLPSAIQMRLVDANGLKYASSIVEGTDQSFLPNQAGMLTLKTPVPGQLSENNLALQFYYSNASDEIELGRMELGASFKTAELNEAQSYTRQAEGEELSIKADKATYAEQSDGVHIQTVVTVTNNGSSIASVPSLLASYQFGDSGASAAVADNSSRVSYLAPQESVSFYFNAALPNGVNPSSAKLIVWDNVGNGGSAATAESTATSTTAGSTSTLQVPVAVISLKGAIEAKKELVLAQEYQLGERLALRNNGLVSPNLAVSLVELHIHENEDLGYQTAIGKYKLTNNGTSAVTLPDLANELINSEGYSYTGTRQTSVPTQIMPGTSYVISYSYLLPQTEAADTYALNIYDDQSVSQGKISMGTYQVAIQEESDNNLLSFYPFLVVIEDHSLTWTYNNGNFSYQLNLNLELQHTDQVIIDSNFSTMEFNLVDALDRVIGSQTMTFTGTDKLISGKQKISFSSLTEEQASSGMRVKIYEVIETPNGNAKRLVKELK